MLAAFLIKLQLCDYSILTNYEYITAEAGEPIAKILSKATLEGLFPAELPGSFSQCFSYQNCSDFLSKITSGYSGEIAYEQHVIPLSDKFNTCVPALLHSETYPNYLTQIICNDEKIQTLITAGKIIGGLVAVTGALYLWKRYRDRQAANPPALSIKRPCYETRP